MMLFLFLLSITPFEIYSVGLRQLLTGPRALVVDKDGVLDLSKKHLKNIDGIEKLAPGIKVLILDDNDIEDVSPLAKLRGLTSVSLASNNVRNALPLLKISTLKRIEIEGNPLNRESFKSLLEDCRLSISVGVDVFDFDKSKIVRGVELFEVAASSDLGKKVYEAGCPICIDSAKPDPLFVTTCFHGFHTQCLDEWVRKNNKCPMCRADLKTQEGVAVAFGAAAIDDDSDV